MFSLKNLARKGLKSQIADKWPTRDHFEMLALENGLSSELRIYINWLEFLINIQYLHLSL